MHQRIGVQAALHQRARLARPTQLDRLGRCIDVVASIDDPAGGQVDAEPFRERLEGVPRAHEDRVDEPFSRSLDRPEERHFRVRRGHGHGDRAGPPTASNEAIEDAMAAGRPRGGGVR